MRRTEAPTRVEDGSSRPGDPSRGGVALINYVTRIHFGFGAIGRLPAELHSLQFRKPLIVTDPGVQRVLPGLFAKIADGALFADTPQNPTEASARAAAEAFVANRCDGIVAIGGGSPMDLSKAAALVVTHGGSLSSYALANGGLERISSNVPPIIAIPTTAGTGSEVARATVIITDSDGKLPIGSPYLIPKVAICDPELTLGLPPMLTAATGFDALSHCVETLCSPNINPPAEAIALDGMMRAVRYLERAVANGTDREARWHMLMASLQGALSFQKGLGAVHALSHPLGELGVHHGTLNAILLPHVIEFNRPRIEGKLQILSRALGLDGAGGLPDFFRDLARRAGLPATLSDLGVTEAAIRSTAAKAERDSCNATNPVPLKADEYETIMRRAMQ
jgi:alcohol dehydrogenase class IV